jgi:deoxyadenosine/deoxycytidine kinase
MSMSDVDQLWTEIESYPEYTSAEMLESHLEWIRNRVRTDKDYIIAVVGEEGSGKSVLASHLAYTLDNDFEIEKNMVYSYEDARQAQYTLPKYSAIVWDEAIFQFFKRNAMTREGKEGVELLNVIRYRNQINIFVIPDLHELENYLSVKRVRTVFECREDKYGNNGIALLKQPYHDQYRYKTNWYTQLTFLFDDMGPETKQRYKAHKHENTLERIFRDESFNRADVSSKEIYNNIKANTDLKDYEIAEKVFGVERTTLYRWKKNRWEENRNEK